MLIRKFRDRRGGPFRLVAASAALALVAVACGDDTDADDTGDPEGTEDVADDDADDDADDVDDDADADAAEDAEDVELSYAFFAPEVTFPAVQMQEWADELDARTQSQVNVDLFPGGTLLGAGDIYDGVSSGVADVGMDSPAYDVSRFPLSAGVALPLGFESSQAASHAMLDLIEEFEPAEFDGFEIITAFTTEPAYLQTVEPVTSRDDLAGMELRSAGAGVPGLELLGAAPVGMPMPEVAESLQTGVIEGYMSSREVLQDFGLAEQVGYVTDYPFNISNTFVAVMDEDRFAELPQDVQDAIHELRREMTTFASEFHDEENVGQALEWAAAEHGTETVELDDGEAEAWDAELEAVIDDWLAEASEAGIDAEAVLDRLNELRDEYNAEYSAN